MNIIFAYIDLIPFNKPNSLKMKTKLQLSCYYDLWLLKILKLSGIKHVLKGTTVISFPIFFFFLPL